MKNRSVPTETVIPHVYYEDVASAIEWLTRVFGFKEYYRYGAPDRPEGGQIVLGGACIQLQKSRLDFQTPKAHGGATQMLTVIVPDVRAQYERTKAARAEIDEDLNETIYGELQFSAKDLAGHRWMFSQHVKDLDPKEWGAIVK